MYSDILNILNQYPTIQSFKALLEHPVHTVIRDSLPQKIERYFKVDRGEWTVEGHDGNGNKAEVPWVGIHYNPLSPSPSQGIYIS